MRVTVLGVNGMTGRVLAAEFADSDFADRLDYALDDAALSAG